MLYVFGFERVGVVAGDLYFVDPNPERSQQGAEHGVRLEVRLMERGPLQGSVYSAQPISIGRAVWRADLLETVDGPPGSFDRTHYHPGLQDWEPGPRVFDRDMSAHPLEWVAGRLSDLKSLLAESGVSPDPADAGDAEELRQRAPEITDAVGRLLDRVRAGELGQPPEDAPALAGARVGWL